MEIIETLLWAFSQLPWLVIIYFIVYKKSDLKWFLDEFGKENYEFFVIALLLLGTPALTESVLPQGAERIESVIDTLGLTISVYLFGLFFTRLAARMRSKCEPQSDEPKSEPAASGQRR